MHLEQSQSFLGHGRMEENAGEITVAETDETFAAIRSGEAIEIEATETIIGPLMDGEFVIAGVGDENAEPHVAAHEFLTAEVGAIEQSAGCVVRERTGSFQSMISLFQVPQDGRYTFVLHVDGKAVAGTQLNVRRAALA